MDWIKKIVPSFGLLIGIILTSIGATLALSSGLKLAFSEPVIYNYACQTNFDSKLERDVQLSSEEKQQCEEKALKEETARFVNEKTQKILDGIAFLVVGIFFWIWFTKKQK